MLAKKEYILLEALLEAEGQYVSSMALSKQIGVTDRTTRKYLQNLMATLEQYGARIHSKQGYGYRLDLFDRPVFERFWQDALDSKKDLTDIRHLEATEDRQRYILQQLLFDQQQLDVDALMAALFISKTTLSTDLNRIKQSLAPYGLRLDQQHRQVSIAGDEQAVRRFLKDYFVDASFENSLLGSVIPSFVNDVDFSKLVLLVLEECRQGQLHLSDFVVHNLVLHLALMSQRLKLGYPLSLFPIDLCVQTSREYEVAMRIVTGLESLLGLPIPVEEANYIALHLKVKHSEQELADGTSQEATDALTQDILSALEELGQHCHCDLVNDHQFVQGLVAHFTPFLSRLDNHIQLANPLLEEIRLRYPHYLALTKTAFQKLPILSCKQVSDDEWAYIALHLIAALERHTSQNTKRVLVVCATGYGSAMMLKSRLESEFGSSLTIVDVVSYYEVSEACLRDVDVIISSLALPSHLFLTPVINVSVFLTADEVAKIRAYLGSQIGFKKLSNKGQALSSDTLSCLSLFKPEQVLVFREPLSREVVLDRMIAKLSDVSSKDAQMVFRQEVDMREGYSSVVYGDCLAFPHPVRPLAFTEEVVVAICPQGIDWNNQHEGIKFIFLLSPSQQRSERLKMLSPCLVDFVADKTLQEQLLQTPTYHQLVTVFKTLLQS